MRRMTRNGRRIVLGLALAVAALGAGTPARAQDGSTSPLAGTSWRLVELNGERVIPGGEHLTLQFSATEPQVSGYGGCNQFSGEYSQNGASLHIGPLLYTRRACLEPALNTQETAYFQALESTTRYSIQGGQLLLYSGNEVVARFVRGGA